MGTMGITEAEMGVVAKAIKSNRIDSLNFHRGLKSISDHLTVRTLSL